MFAAGNAAVLRLEVQERAPVLAGRPFGSAGTYERLTGKAHFAVDPAHPRNRDIVDIQHAPRNAKGQVEFSADLEIIRPADLSKGNGTVLFEVVNRGGKGMLTIFNRAQGSNQPRLDAHFGDGRLLAQGYTLVYLGWQTDVPRDGARMRLYAPAAVGQTGLVRSEYAPDRPVAFIPLGDSNHIPYAVAAGTRPTVTVREGIEGERRALAADEWTLAKDGIQLKQAATPGRIYEVVYTAADPPVAGLGLAAVRDLIAYLKREHRYAIGWGVSQSAMMLRAFLYEGFNQDESGARVFDGIFAHVAGGRRSTFQRFTQPSRTAGPLRNASLTTTEQFPFADLDQTDHISGTRDGILRSAKAASVVPKIFYTNSAYEYWGSAGSLNHTTTDGRRDLPPPDNTRIYLMAGGQHGPAAFPPVRRGGRNLPNFNDYRWTLRSLLAKLQAWIADGAAPPPSQYPTIASGTLVPLEEYRFPKIPDVIVPTRIHNPALLDFGQTYRSKGLITIEPPRIVGRYRPLVPQAAPDGNDAAGIRMPELVCAIATYTGWNLRHPDIGAPEYLLGNTGSYIPFARTRAERTASGDPRPSAEERFQSEEGYTGCVANAARSLAAGGFLLNSDVAPVTRAAERHWRWRMRREPVSSDGGF
jgi:hypothetical protein